MSGANGKIFSGREALLHKGFWGVSQGEMRKCTSETIPERGGLLLVNCIIRKRYFLVLSVGKRVLFVGKRSFLKAIMLY